MPANPQRVYVDANALLAYISGETGRAPIVRALLEEAHRGEIDILTSVLSIAEVAYGAQERDSGLTTAGEQRIDTLWEPASPITLVDISERLTRDARSIIRDAKSRNLSGIRSADALHLATARLHGVDVIYTYENLATRSKWNQLTGIDVGEPITNTPQLDV